ncbi:MAG TPA: hypothetical protein VES60_05825 [Nakamurella sp.]|nr:hypothetical protein [Nakamurella sp.]
MSNGDAVFVLAGLGQRMPVRLQSREVQPAGFAKAIASLPEQQVCSGWSPTAAGSAVRAAAKTAHQTPRGRYRPGATMRKLHKAREARKRARYAAELAHPGVEAGNP